MSEERLLSDMEKGMVDKVIEILTTCEIELVKEIINSLIKNYFPIFIVINHLFNDCFFHYMKQLAYIDLGKVFKNEKSLLIVDKEVMDEIRELLMKKRK